MRNEDVQGGQGGGVRRRDNIVKLIRHELNTPLATALLYIGIAEGSAAQLPEGAVHSALRVARTELQRLKALLDTVTELECVGYATPRPRSINVGETVRATVQRLVADTRRRPFGVVTVGDLQGWWDRSMVEQIVGNLLSNALKFGLGRPIRIDVKPAEYGVHISVRDHGIGVCASEQESIFERNVHAGPRKVAGLASDFGSSASSLRRTGAGSRWKAVKGEGPPSPSSYGPSGPRPTSVDGDGRRPAGESLAGGGTKVTQEGAVAGPQADGKPHRLQITSQTLTGA